MPNDFAAIDLNMDDDDEQLPYPTTHASKYAPDEKNIHHYENNNNNNNNNDNKYEHEMSIENEHQNNNIPNDLRSMKVKRSKNIILNNDKALRVDAIIDYDNSDNNDIFNKDININRNDKNTTQSSTSTTLNQNRREIKMFKKDETIQHHNNDGNGNNGNGTRGSSVAVLAKLGVNKNAMMEKYSQQFSAATTATVLPTNMMQQSHHHISTDSEENTWNECNDKTKVEIAMMESKQQEIPEVNLENEWENASKQCETQPERTIGIQERSASSHITYEEAVLSLLNILHKDDHKLFNELSEKVQTWDGRQASFCARFWVSIVCRCCIQFMCMPFSITNINLTIQS
jgi:hypothetical protein